MFSIGKRFTFDAAHVLHGLPAGHKCGRLHGHTYTVELHLQAETLIAPGFVTDFADLAPFGRYLDEQFDHRLLNDVLAAEPTSEELAAHFFAWCAQYLAPTLSGGRIVAVRVSETPSSWAEFRETST
jgi:6-pyruvoyltetrahydropterin/6-carboxytetrahydropterin synthase